MSAADPITRLNAALEGRYRIERELGEGGMATVYLADDIKHERKVALKVLKPELAAVVGAERFLAEIKTTANLQHPHILPLHDSGEADGFLYYVMPYVEGESLRDRLDREHQLPVDDALRIATNVAEALDYAHRQGVIHRDIKPANILLQDGKPVISDFGIALAVSTGGGGRLTETGLSLGTPHYMSPEQATGDQNVGPGTDIYALGCVLYEMLVGEPPFTGSTPQAVLGKIITAERPLASAVRESVPTHVDAVISKALEKVPADRFRDADTFVAAITDTSFVAPPQPVRRAATTAYRAPLTIALALLALASTTIALWQWLIPTPEPAVTRFTVDVPGGYLVDFGQPNLALSPDGAQLAFSGGGNLHLRQLDEFEATVIPGTFRSRSVFFAPDGRSIGFNGDGTLVRMDLDGGAPIEIATDVQSVMGASWADDGSIVFAPVLGVDGLYSIAEDGGQREKITSLVDSLGETAHRWPFVLPGSRHLIFTASGPSSAWDDSRLVIQDLTTGEREFVFPGATHGRVLPTGHLLYAVPSGALEVVPFDLDALEVTGGPVNMIPLTQLGAVSGASSYSVSQNGTIAFVADSIWSAQSLQLVGRDGTLLRTLGPDLYADYPRFSPDGSRVLLTLRTARNDDIQVLESPFRDLQRLSTALPEDETPIWSPSGDSLAYTSKGPGQIQLVYVQPAVAGTEPGLVYEAPFHNHLSSWSPDGGFIAYHEYHPTRRTDVWAFDVDSSSHVIPIDTTEAASQDAVFSPDGNWVAYSRADETGRHEIWIRSFPDPDEFGLPVTSNGGVRPMWSRNGSELFYFEGTTLMSLPVSIGTTFRAMSPPVRLFDVPDIAINDASPDFDVHPDGDSFLLLTDDREAAPQQIRVILNWFEELRQRMGSN